MKLKYQCDEEEDAASFPKPITTCCSVLPPEIVMHDAYIGGRFLWTKSLVKPVTWFFHEEEDAVGWTEEDSSQ